MKVDYRQLTDSMITVNLAIRNNPGLAIRLCVQDRTEVDMLSIQGTVERITYRNEDNLYTVARISCEGRGPTGRGRQIVTVVGTFLYFSWRDSSYEG